MLSGRSAAGAESVQNRDLRTLTHSGDSKQVNQSVSLELAVPKQRVCSATHSISISISMT